MIDRSEGPDVSVIIVNFNGGDRLKACLRALGVQDGISFETIVVDNASTDGSGEWLRAVRPPLVLAESGRNLGFAGGNNLGAAKARGTYLAFLNNDAQPESAWLVTLRQALEENPWAGLATSKIVYCEDASIIDSAGDGLTRAGGAFKIGHGQPAESAGVSRQVFGACGAAFMMRRNLFTEVGGFDEDFFLSHEDVDLSYRVQLRGFGCVYVPGAVVHHAVSATLGRVSRQAAYYGQRNLEWLYWKNTPRRLLLRTLIPHVLYGLAGAIYHARIGLLRPFLLGKLAALRGLPDVLRKRRRVQAAMSTTPERILGLMEKHWFTLKWREKRFDLRVSGRHV